MTARTQRPGVVAADRRRAGESHAGSRLLRGMSGALLIAALVFAPWCWACTWPNGIHTLDLILLAASIPGLVDMLLRRERPPRALMLAITLILAQGWAMTLNSRGLFAETTGLFAPLQQLLDGWPGSVERDLSWETMTRITALLGAALVAASLGRSRRWRHALIHTIVAVAVSLVLLGCAQRWSRAEDIFWGVSRHLDYFFATFRNVTNAGEFLNLAVPLAAAVAWNARHGAPIYKAWATAALALLVAGSCICGSKAAAVLTAGLGVFFLLLHARELRRSGARAANRIAVAAVLVGAMALIVWGAGLGVTQDRWHRLLDASGDATLTNRLRVDQACVSGLSDAGLFGSGPGAFPAIFPGLEEQLAQPPPGRWLFAHNDYLQTALEWGAFGAAAWTLYYFGALAILARGLRRGAWRREDATQAAGLLAALAGAALMGLADFPFQIASLQLDLAVLAGLGWSSRAWPQVRLDCI